MTARPTEVRGIGVLPVPLVARPVSKSLPGFSHYGAIHKEIVIKSTMARSCAGRRSCRGRERCRSALPRVACPLPPVISDPPEDAEHG
jgi:hypothetical protein